MHNTRYVLSLQKYKTASKKILFCVHRCSCASACVHVLAQDLGIEMRMKG